MKLITNMILLLSALFIATAQAEDEEATAPNEEVIYVELKPAFVTNYQSHKMGYLKADVTLQVNTTNIAQFDYGFRHEKFSLNKLDCFDGFYGACSPGWVQAGK